LETKDDPYTMSNYELLVEYEWLVISDSSSYLNDEDTSRLKIIRGIIHMRMIEGNNSL
jgi:hypothetical protein